MRQRLVTCQWQRSPRLSNLAGADSSAFLNRMRRQCDLWRYLVALRLDSVLFGRNASLA
jgi:hypothetical protein